MSLARRKARTDQPSSQQCIVSPVASLRDTEDSKAHLAFVDRVDERTNKDARICPRQAGNGRQSFAPHAATFLPNIVTEVLRLATGPPRLCFLPILPPTHDCPRGECYAA